MVRANTLALTFAAKGQYQEAADATLNVPRESVPPGAPGTASRLLRMVPAPARQQNIPYLGVLSWVFAYVGLPDRALEFEEHVTAAGYYDVGFPTFWRSEYAAVRKTARFKALVRKMGLVDYWRATSWPDLCHPTTGDDFACN